MSRKGIPDVVSSDNFKAFQSIEVKRFITQHQIIQKVILLTLAWRGGFYERLIRNIKTSLKKVQSFLSYEELETLLCDVEAKINSRPLIYVSEDDLSESLTPCHLLYGQNVFQKTLQNIPKDLKSLPCRVKYLQILINSYWKVFIALFK